MKIAGIVDGELETLLKMAGANIYSYEEFDEIIKREDVAILIISEKFTKLLEGKIIKHRLHGDMPFIVEISGEDSLKRVIVRAVGLEV
ncbi:MAG: V-type ATP synthase subunit F [Candidatus Thermoplasmatota archaeon]